MRLDAHSVALDHSLEQDAQVELAAPIQHRLVDGGMMLDAHARIFGDQLVQSVRKPLFIAAALRRDCNTQHGRRKAHCLQVIMVLVVRIMQHRVQVQLFDLCDRADIARNRRRNLRGFLPQQLEQVRDLDRLPRAAYEQLATRTEGALMYSKHSQLADVGVDAHFEYVRDDMLVGVWDHLHALRGIPLARQEMRRIALGRIRQQALEDFQQLLDAHAGLGGGEADGDEVALSQGLLKRVVELLRRECLALLQIQRHQLFIDFDDLIDDLRVSALHG